MLPCEEHDYILLKICLPDITLDVMVNKQMFLFYEMILVFVICFIFALYLYVFFIC